VERQKPAPRFACKLRDPDPQRLLSRRRTVDPSHLGLMSRGGDPGRRGGGPPDQIPECRKRGNLGSRRDTLCRRPVKRRGLCCKQVRVNLAQQVLLHLTPSCCGAGRRPPPSGARTLEDRASACPIGLRHASRSRFSGTIGHQHATGASPRSALRHANHRAFQHAGLIVKHLFDFFGDRYC